MRPTFPAKNTVALAAISLTALMFGLEISSVPVILPTLERVLDADFPDLQWIMNGYTVACTAVLMAAGALADRYGRKRIFVVSLAIFGLTSLVCGWAQDVRTLTIGRCLQGVGAGAMLICQMAALSHQFQAGRERSRAFAIWGIVFGIGLGFGPIIGGAIMALANWRWVFLIHVPLSLATLAMVVGSVQESHDPDAQRIDTVGIVTLSLSVFCLTYAITLAPVRGFTDVVVIAGFAIAVVGMLLFVWAEQINPHPMFDFSVFRIRAFSGAILGSIGMNFSFWPFLIYLPIHFQSGLGYDTVAAGFALLAYTLPTLVIPPLAERLSLRYQARRVVPAGLFTIGLGFLLMRHGTGMDIANGLGLLPGCVLAGVGLGLTNTPVSNTAIGAVPATRAGMASGIDMSARLITLAINIALMGLILLRGITTHLQRVLDGQIEPSRLQGLAERVASGDIEALHRAFPTLQFTDSSVALAQAALAHGIGDAMLYAGIGAWVFAVASFLAFGPTHRRRQITTLSTGTTSAS